MRRRSPAARAPAPAVARRAPAAPTGAAGAGQRERLVDLNQALGNQAMGALLTGGAPGLGAAREAPSLLGPEVPAPKVVRAGTTVALTVYFGKDHFLLDARNLRAVEALSEELKWMIEPTITVDGHASAEGEPAYNQTLSERRRDLVIALLSKDREPRPTFGGTAHGEDAPAVAESGSGESLERLRAQNRRVEIVAAPKAFSPLPLPESEGKSPLKLQLTPPEMQKLFPETPEERLERRIREGELKLPESKGSSLEERFGKAADPVLDGFLQSVGVKDPKKRRFVREQLKGAFESGIQKVFDKAVDATDLEPEAKEAVKKLFEVGIKVPF